MTKHDDQGAVFDTQAIRNQAEAVSFFVPGKPQGKGRPRAARRGSHITLYTPEKTASYESLVALVASRTMAGRTPIQGPVTVTLWIHLPIPVSWSKKKQTQAAADEILPIVKPDVDNVIKAVFDAINGVVWRDDTQVVIVTASKSYRATPGVTVAVFPWEGR